MKKKIVIMLLAAVTAVTAFGCTSKNNSEDRRRSSTRESISVDTTDASTTEDSTETVTVPDVTIDEEAALSDDSRMAFANILSELSYRVGRYYWQFDYEYNGYSFDIVGENPIVNLYDINDDGEKEMLVVSCLEYDVEVANLTIYGVDDNGELAVLYDDAIDANAGGSCSYMVFRSAGNTYISTTYLSEGEAKKLEVLEVGTDGKLSKKELASFESMYVDSPSYENVESASINGNDVSVDEFNNYYNDIVSKSNCVLLYSSGYSDYADNIGADALTLGEAANRIVVNKDVPDDQLPLYSEISMSFSSGAGGWGTELTLRPDGSFIGSYHDSDMGVTGDDYPDGTVYISEFEGNFKNIRKIDEYTYYMELDGYTLSETPGVESIEDGIRWIYSEPYGIEGGNGFYVYLPGAKVSDLPEEYVYWIWGLSDKISLPNFGLYNEAQEEGFIAY